MALSGSEDGPSPARCVRLTTYLQQAQTGVWDVRASFLPAIYFEGSSWPAASRCCCRRSPSTPTSPTRSSMDSTAWSSPADAMSTRQAYGQQPHPATDDAVGDNRQRDALEFALLDGAVRRGMPVLGICRGAQVLNVALGGTLHQHLPDVLGHTRHQQGNAVFSTSSVRTVPGTRLAALIGESSDAQCYHHQAIDRLGDGLIVSAQDADGVIEAVEIDPASRTSFWRCSGTPRNGWTICGCSPRWSRPPPAYASRKGERVTRQRADQSRPPRSCCAPSSRPTRRASTTRWHAPWPPNGTGPGWPRPSGPRRCARSPRSSTRTSTSWPRWRWPTPDTRSATRSGRPATSATCCSSTRPPRNGLSGKQIPVAGGLDVTFNEPLGVVGVITPWNFPMTIAVVGLRARAGRGQRGAGQARRVDAADHDPARRARGRGGPARRPVPGAAGQGLGGGGAVRHPSRCPQDRVHRLHRGRHAGDGGRGGPGQAGHPGAGRQERQHRVRRLRSGEGRGHRAVRRLRQRRPGLLRA